MAQAVTWGTVENGQAAEAARKKARVTQRKVALSSVWDNEAA
jgi:hypothetical protein